MNQNPKSLVLVTVDCLRADHVGFMGYERPTTPFLDALAAESLIVPQAVVAGAPTYYSFPAILASRYPLSLGRDVLGVSHSEPTLGTVLHDAGYATASFGAANPYISARFGYDQGFDVFRDFLEDDSKPLLNEQGPPASDRWMSRLNRRLQRIRSRIGPIGIVYDELYFRYCQRVSGVPASLDALRRFPAADEIVDHACEWLPSVSGRPFFMWLHLMDPHAPYYPKSEALQLMGDDSISPVQARYTNSSWNRSDLRPRRLQRWRPEVVKLYDAGIRWVDEQMARLIATLKKANRWSDTVFAFTADHGEEFLDHGGRYHPPSTLAKELVHVPLLLRLPRVRKTNVTGTPFSMLHLAPTLLDAMDIAAPEQFCGKSQLQPLTSAGDFPGVVISECVAGCTNPFRPENRMGPRVLAVREGHFKLVIFFDPRSERLYDLQADPREQAPLPESVHRDVRCRLLDAARDHIARSLDARDDTTRAQARLRDLRLEWVKPAEEPLPVAS